MASIKERLRSYTACPAGGSSCIAKKRSEPYQRRGTGKVLKVCPKTKKILEVYDSPAQVAEVYGYVGPQFLYYLCMTLMGEKAQFRGYCWQWSGSDTTNESVDTELPLLNGRDGTDDILSVSRLEGGTPHVQQTRPRPKSGKVAKICPKTKEILQVYDSPAQVAESYGHTHPQFLYYLCMTLMGDKDKFRGYCWQWKVPNFDHDGTAKKDSPSVSSEKAVDKSTFVAAKQQVEVKQNTPTLHGCTLATDQRTTSVGSPSDETAVTVYQPPTIAQVGLSVCPRNTAYCGPLVGEVTNVRQVGAKQCTFGWGNFYPDIPKVGSPSDERAVTLYQPPPIAQATLRNTPHCGLIAGYVATMPQVLMKQNIFEPDRLCPDIQERIAKVGFPSEETAITTFQAPPIAQKSRRVCSRFTTRSGPLVGKVAKICQTTGKVLQVFDSPSHVVRSLDIRGRMYASHLYQMVLGRTLKYNGFLWRFYGSDGNQHEETQNNVNSTVSPSTSASHTRDIVTVAGTGISTKRKWQSGSRIGKAAKVCKESGNILQVFESPSQVARVHGFENTRFLSGLYQTLKGNQHTFMGCQWYRYPSVTTRIDGTPYVTTGEVETIEQDNTAKNVKETQLASTACREASELCGDASSKKETDPQDTTEPLLTGGEEKQSSESHDTGILINGRSNAPSLGENDQKRSRAARTIQQICPETGKVLATFNSAPEAANVLGKAADVSSIYKVLNTPKRQTCWGFKWRYKASTTTSTKKKEPPRTSMVLRKRRDVVTVKKKEGTKRYGRIAKVCCKTDKIIQVYDSPAHVARSHGYESTRDLSDFYQVLKGNKETFLNYKWRHYTPDMGASLNLKEPPRRSEKTDLPPRQRLPREAKSKAKIALDTTMKCQDNEKTNKQAKPLTVTGRPSAPAALAKGTQRQRQCKQRKLDTLRSKRFLPPPCDTNHDEEPRTKAADTTRKVRQLCPNTGTVLATFESATEASKHFGKNVSGSNIYKALNNVQQSCWGYDWRREPEIQRRNNSQKRKTAPLDLFPKNRNPKRVKFTSFLPQRQKKNPNSTSTTTTTTTTKTRTNTVARKKRGI